jgi:hypothetical protein
VVSHSIAMRLCRQCVSRPQAAGPHAPAELPGLSKGLRRHGNRMGTPGRFVKPAATTRKLHIYYSKPDLMSEAWVV